MLSIRVPRHRKLIEAGVSLVAAAVIHVATAEARVPEQANSLERASALQPARGRLSGGHRLTGPMQMDVPVIARLDERLRLRLGLPGSADAAASALRRHPPRSRLTGTASTYNPCKPGYRTGGLETASGDSYNPEDWSAAIQIDFRALFGGVHFGRNYRPAFALIGNGGRRAIVRINDVGPLLPGRVVDLNENAMRYFDPTMKRGLLPDIDLAPLPGTGWRAGPLEREPDIGMAGEVLPSSIR